ncbi:RHS repeat-associated protein [Haloferula luteola]|uniref:RHS repeat-associated protein n=1 Tax=Haloferula luteola TaxID=595692 RepID=A0A840VJ04_9BACT|nr:RHS repeat-associated core domain-containing protein [Haloferula luteola]MBB5352681.1 RHS repeat-associated protein [Haloferula luteola]
MFQNLLFRQIAAGFQLLLFACSTLLPGVVHAQTRLGPEWWYRGESPWISSENGDGDGHLISNVGQGKNAAVKALENLEDTVVGQVIHGDLIPSIFDDSPPTAAEVDANYSPLQIGQLKALAKPFYDRLNEIDPLWVRDQLADSQVTSYQASSSLNASWGYVVGGYYPWDPALTQSETRRAPATIGQVKAVFCLDLDLVQSIEDPMRDTDGDGLPDWWELAHGLDRTDAQTEWDDFDGDGLSDLDEYAWGTSATVSDTDGDGMSDADEIAMGFNPLNSDENGNGIPDGAEDFDGDGLMNLFELELGSNPAETDSDGDLMPDVWELRWGLDPLDASDAQKDFDGDGVMNYDEYRLGTRPVGAWTGGEFQITSLLQAGEVFRVVDSFTEMDTNGVTSRSFLLSTVLNGVQNLKLVRGLTTPTLYNLNLPGVVDFEAIMGFDPTGAVVISTTAGAKKWSLSSGWTSTLTPSASSYTLPTGSTWDLVALSPTGSHWLWKTLDVSGNGYFAVSDPSGAAVADARAAVEWVASEEQHDEWTMVLDDGRMVGIRTVEVASGEFQGLDQDELVTAEWSGGSSGTWEVEPLLLSGDIAYWGLDSGLITVDLYAGHRRDSFPAFRLSQSFFDESLELVTTGEWRVFSSLSLDFESPSYQFLVKKEEPHLHSGIPSGSLPSESFPILNYVDRLADAGYLANGDTEVRVWSVLPDTTFLTNGFALEADSVSAIAGDVGPSSLVVGGTGAQGDFIRWQEVGSDDLDDDGMPDDWEKLISEQILAGIGTPDSNNPDHQSLILGDLPEGYGISGSGPNIADLAQAGVVDDDLVNHTFLEIEAKNLSTTSGNPIPEFEYQFDNTTESRTEGSHLIYSFLAWLGDAEEQGDSTSVEVPQGAYVNGDSWWSSANSIQDYRSEFYDYHKFPLFDAGMSKVEGEYYEDGGGFTAQKEVPRFRLFNQSPWMRKDALYLAQYTQRYRSNSTGRLDLNHNDPLYQYSILELTLDEGEGLADSWTYGRDLPFENFGLFADYKSIANATREITAEVSVDVQSIPISSPMGPADHRKISLRGKPIGDQQPQSEEESDIESEEAYVDAFDRRLNFDTSLLWAPQGSSELVLSVNLSYNPQALRYEMGPIYKNQPASQGPVLGQTQSTSSTGTAGEGEVIGTSLRGNPNNSLLIGPFGVGFSTNLRPTLNIASDWHTENQTKKDANGQEVVVGVVSSLRYLVKVTDSNGRVHDFESSDMRNFRKSGSLGPSTLANEFRLIWMPYTDAPRSTTSGDCWGHYVLRSRFGTECYFPWYGDDPSTGGSWTYESVEKPTTTFADLAEAAQGGMAYGSRVTDRFGNSIRYRREGDLLYVEHFSSGCLDSEGEWVSGITPTGVIEATYDGSVVTSLKDPRGQVYRLEYGEYTLPGSFGRWTGFAGSTSNPHWKWLRAVHCPDGSVKRFQFEHLKRREGFGDLGAYGGSGLQGGIIGHELSKRLGKQIKATEYGVIPLLTRIEDGSGQYLDVEYERDVTELTGIQYVNLVGRVPHEDFADLPADAQGDALLSQYCGRVVTQAKYDYSPKVAADQLLAGYRRAPQNEEPDPAKMASGFWYKVGIPQAIPVKSVSTADVDGDGGAEVYEFQGTGFDESHLGFLDNVSNGDIYRETTVKSDGYSTVYEFSHMMMLSEKRNESGGSSSGGSSGHVCDSSVGEAPVVFNGTLACGHLAIRKSLGRNPVSSSDFVVEEFDFNPRAGGVVSKAVDASGNTTEYFYEDVREGVAQAIADGWIIEARGASSTTDATAGPIEKYYPDPTRVVTHTGGTTVEKSFTYTSGALRLQESVTDELGRVTAFDFNALGLRTGSKIFANAAEVVSGDPIQETEWKYESAEFPMFLTEEVTKAIPGGGDPSWVEDIVKQYEPDAAGRIWKEKTLLEEDDPMTPGDEGVWITTTNLYDESGNKIAVTDARGNTTDFFYDGMNRLSFVRYPATPTAEAALQAALGGGVASSGPRAEKSYRYDLGGRKVRELDENGNALLWEYNLAGMVQRSAVDMNRNYRIDAEDLITQYVWDRRARLVKKIDPMEGETSMTYDGLNRLVQTVDALGGVSQLDYDLSANSGGDLFQGDGFKPTRVVDPRGYVTETRYDDRYRPIAVRTEYQKNSGDWRTRALGPCSLTISAYDEVGNVLGTLSFRDASGITLPTNNPSISDLEAWDSLDVLYTKTEYDDLNRPVLSVVEPNNTLLKQTTATRYTSTGWTWKTVMFQGSALQRDSHMVYDRAGRVIEERSPNPKTGVSEGPLDACQFDGPGRVLKTYDANGNLLTVTDPLGMTTTQSYDDRNRLVRVEAPAVEDAEWGTVHPPVTSTVYDAVGNTVYAVDPRGTVVKTDYDAAHRPYQTIAAYGLDEQMVTISEFDANGNVVAVTDPNGNVTRNRYDSLNRLVASARNPVTGNPADPWSAAAGDQVIANQYDASGNLIAVADGLAAKEWEETDQKWLFDEMMSAGHVTGFTYDGLGRKTATLWDMGSVVERKEQMFYDGLVQTSAKRPDLRETQFNYDGLMRVASTVFPGHSDENLTYFYQTGISDFGDNAPVVPTTQGPGGLVAVLHGNLNGSDSRDVIQELDYQDRVVSEMSGGATHNHVLDLVGNRRLTRSYDLVGGSTRSLYCEYDALHRMTDCLDLAAHAPPVGWRCSGISPQAGDQITTYAYDSAGNVVEKELPNGQVTTTVFDALNRRLLMEVTIGSTVISRHDYSHPVAGSGLPSGYDRVGNVLRILEDFGASSLKAREIINTYDKLDRLDEERIAESTNYALVAAGTAPVTQLTDYDYDLADNRTVKDVQVGSAPGEWQYEYGSPAAGTNTNQLVNVKKEVANNLYEWIAAYTYDPNGNRVAKYDQPGVGFSPVEEYQYDSLNRLTLVEDHVQSQDFQYRYDHRSRRVERNQIPDGGASEMVRLSFLGGTSVQEYFDGVTQPTVEQIRGSDWGGGVGGILYTYRRATPSSTPAATFVAFNSRGDVISRTDALGGIVWQGQYEAFGTRTAEQGTDLDVHHANTKEEDPTGFLNEGMRYRDLEMGVFLTRDPAGFVDGPNVYTYVRQNPWTMYDPHGLFGFGESNGAWIDAAWNAVANPARDYAYDMGNEWMTMSDRSSDKGNYVTAVAQGTMGNFVNALGAMVDKDAHNAMVERGVAITSSAAEDGHVSVLEGAQMVGVAGGEFFGWNDGVEAATGNSLEDGRELSGMERFQKGTSATAKAAGTAAMLSGPLKPGGTTARGTAATTAKVTESTLHTRGVRPAAGTRTLEGYVQQTAAQAEVGLYTKSPGFDVTAGSTQFKRFGSGSHGGLSPHVHQPLRNMTPRGARGTTGTKTKNGGVTKPSRKDVKQLYDHVENGKYAE